MNKYKGIFTDKNGQEVSYELNAASFQEAQTRLKKLGATYNWEYKYTI